MCAEEFSERNEKCRFNEESPPSNMYPFDELTCSANGINSGISIITSLIIVLVSLVLR